MWSFATCTFLDIGEFEIQLKLMTAQLASWDWVTIHHNFCTHNQQNRVFIAEETAFWHLYPWIMIHALIIGFFLLLLFDLNSICYIPFIPFTEGQADISCDTENLKEFCFSQRRYIITTVCWKIGCGCCTERFMLRKESYFKCFNWSFIKVSLHPKSPCCSSW